MSSKHNEFDSLLKLLCDDNRFVSQAAAERLYEIIDNQETYEKLLRATNGDDLILQLRVRQILDRHRIDNYEQNFKEFSKSPTVDLEEGCKLIAGEDYYDEETQAVTTALDSYANEIKKNITAEMSDDEKVEALIHYLFDVKEFKGNRENYFSLDNSFLNRVIELKKGIPLTLGILMILVGKRIDLTLHAISVPTHFLVHYGDDFDINFLDPFNRGHRLTRQECFDFLKRVGVVPHPTHLEPASARHVLIRMLRNVAAIYHQSQAHTHAGAIEKRIRWLSE